MTDLLIRLYDLPDFAETLHKVERQGILIRRARAYEKFKVVDWVRGQFGEGWAGECDAAFSRQPIPCLIAATEGHIAGFACHDCTCRDFLGPIGVREDFRKKGLGAALLAKSLLAMASKGYAYAIVGDGGQSQDFYSRIVEVQPIAGSTPGIYENPLS